MDTDKENTSSIGSKESVWPSRIISALLGIAVTVVAALIVQYLTTRDPKLTYSSVETVPFSGTNNVVGIYQVVIRNDGKREIEGIGCYVRIPGAKIEQYRTLTAPSLAASAAANNDALKVDVPSLNPGETAQVSILATNSAWLPSHPEISVRAKGVMGEEQSPAGPTKIESVIPFFTAGMALVALLSTFLFRKLLSDVGGGSQQKILASICKVRELKEREERYTKGGRLTYFGEADRLGQEAMESGSPEVTSEVKAILSDLLSADRSIRDSSMAVVLYNLARIAIKEDKKEEATSLLGRALGFDAEEVLGRYRLDPIFRGIPL